MLGARRPPSHTALAALPAIALDLETTGLDVANDRIVQIGILAAWRRFAAPNPHCSPVIDRGGRST